MKEALLDSLSRAFFLYTLLADIPNGISNLFSQLIVGFGYTPEEPLLYGTPDGTLEIIAPLACGLAEDRYGHPISSIDTDILPSLSLHKGRPLDISTQRCTTLCSCRDYHYCVLVCIFGHLGLHLLPLALAEHEQGENLSCPRLRQAEESRENGSISLIRRIQNLFTLCK
ncbi:hypothetical protein P154DRAFT_288758 [Amniculicola lignicola CBS 123094]|uniref:Uncharacterized protein n=1 Tax=Amniculicola lignicola CBS 123094 TaxID=1392246 RepID=A0A6A5WY67_9PLEO|nr:hypothetical protein P154DRAFT_288758 [Amniculicola lignicola CBS 123094]